MKVVYFINKTNGFPKSMISFMESNFPEIKKSYYIVDRRKEEILPKLENVHRILSYKEFITNQKLIGDMKSADKIIVSGVFTLQYIMPIYGKNILKKIYWQFWGGDYEVFRSSQISQKVKIRKKFVFSCIKKSKGIILLTKPEIKVFNEIFGSIVAGKIFTAVVPSGQEDEEILMNARKEKKQDKICRIVIGNSATESNQHLAVFEKMKRLDVSNVKIYCPLSYGDSKYRDKVIKKGKEQFGNQFYAITEYMTYEEYVRFLNSCDVGIYDNNRQQALGNISLMLNLGKKVYVSESIRKYYEQFGYKLYSTNEIETKTITDVLKFDVEDAEKNYMCYDLRKKKIYYEWERVLGQ